MQLDLKWSRGESCFCLLLREDLPRCDPPNARLLFLPASFFPPFVFSRSRQRRFFSISRRVRAISSAPHHKVTSRGTACPSRGKSFPSAAAFPRSVDSATPIAANLAVLPRLHHPLCSPLSAPSLFHYLCRLSIVGLPPGSIESRVPIRDF